MDRGGCRMNGEGGSRDGESGSRLGVITLEDLESFTEDDLNTELVGEEPNGEPEEDRLLHFWQDVGRGHHIDIPQDMAQPIQQLTTGMEATPNSEKVPLTLITRKEKCGSVLYEKRVCEKAYWACITAREDTYEQSICAGFMKLMRFICQQNTSGGYLGMTVPIVTVVRTDDAQASLFRDVTVAYYLPSHLQDQPPTPLDPDVTMEIWPSTTIYSRTFTGPTNETTILREIHAFAQVLDTPDQCVHDSFIIAGYTSPAAAHRENEIWFLERH